MQKILFSLACLLISSAVLPTAANADEGSSMDSMWIDQEAPTIDKTGADTNTKGSSSSVASAAVPNTVAPMCSFEEFRSSPFVSKGNWPGLGPFKASGGDISEMTDARQNHLKVSVKNEQITSAELGLGKLDSGNLKDFLDIEMSSDFLLESLGAKPRKIAEFNKALEKGKQQIKPGANPFVLNAGRYQVIISRSKSAQPYSCLIAVNSLDASKSVILSHSNIGEEPSPDKTTGETKNPAGETKHPIIDQIKNKIPLKPKAPPTASTPPADQKKEEFVAAVKSWQQVKKAALKKRDATHLADILGGAALAKQTTAVKWLQSHGNFYDMEPRGCVVEKYTDLGGGKKYSVITQVHEFSKYIKEADNSVLKEVDDKYTVNYTIEKINDKWMITDSAVVPPAGGAAATTTKKPAH